MLGERQVVNNRAQRPRLGGWGAAVESGFCNGLLEQFCPEALKVVENHLAVDTAKATLMQNPGHIRITVPTNSTYVPVWMFDQVKDKDSSFSRSEEVVALELRVIAPGTVKAIGFWPDNLCGMAFTNDAMMLCVKDNPNSPIVIVTELKDSTDQLATITYGGDIINPMFAFER